MAASPGKAHAARREYWDIKELTSSYLLAKAAHHGDMIMARQILVSRSKRQEMLGDKYSVDISPTSNILPTRRLLFEPLNALFTEARYQCTSLTVVAHANEYFS
jgi:hypothetical protein